MAEREPSRMKRWAKYGSIVGYALAMLYMNAWTPAHLGFYIGPTPALLVFAMLIGGGALIGAGFGWLEDRLPPDSGFRG